MGCRPSQWGEGWSMRLFIYHVWNKIGSSNVLLYFHNDMLILFWNCFKVKSRPAPIKYKSLRGHVWLENSSFPVKRICNYKFIACISKCFLRICCYLSKTLELAFLQNYHLSASCLDYRRVLNSIGGIWSIYARCTMICKPQWTWIRTIPFKSVTNG